MSFFTGGEVPFVFYYGDMRTMNSKIFESFKLVSGQKVDSTLLEEILLMELALCRELKKHESAKEKTNE